MKLFFSLLAVFINYYLFAQDIHVKYFHVRSPIATLYEDLYISKDKVISRQDSIVNFVKQGSDEFAAIKKGNGKTNAFYFISNLSKNREQETQRNFFFTGYIQSTDAYFVVDNVPKLQWVIDKTDKKKILDYECFKATTSFRGSEIIAYFTEKIPVSAGPFKFYGLPGLILDIRAKNKNYDIWKAEKIEFDKNQSINFQPNFDNFIKIQMKDFISKKEEKKIKDRQERMNNLPQGVSIDFPQMRFGLEQKFEWEK